MQQETKKTVLDPQQFADVYRSASLCPGDKVLFLKKLKEVFQGHSVQSVVSHELFKEIAKDVLRSSDQKVRVEAKAAVVDMLQKGDDSIKMRFGKTALELLKNQDATPQERYVNFAFVLAKGVPEIMDRTPIDMFLNVLCAEQPKTSPLDLIMLKTSCEGLFCIIKGKSSLFTQDDCERLSDARAKNPDYKVRYLFKQICVELGVRRRDLNIPNASALACIALALKNPTTIEFTPMREGPPLKNYTSKGTFSL